MAWIRIEQVYAGKEINKPPQTIYLNEEHIVSLKPYKVGKTMEGYLKQDLLHIKMIDGADYHASKIELCKKAPY